MQSIGDRMKNNYEDRHRYYLTRRIPVIVRLDGKAFHSYTRNFKFPFDQRLIGGLLDATKFCTDEIQGFKLAYIQSDEVSFLISDFDHLTTEAWFDYNKSKIESVLASMFSVYFNNEMSDYGIHDVAAFDARAFNIPKEEVANYFLWRQLDWERNSVHMFARKFYSHKQLYGKTRSEQHDMIYRAGYNWANLPNKWKNGTYVLPKNKIIEDIQPNYEQISQLISPLMESIDD